MQPAFGSIPEGGSWGGTRPAPSLSGRLIRPVGGSLSALRGGRRRGQAAQSARCQPLGEICAPPRRSLVLKCSSYRQARWWGQQITELAASKGREHLQRHRHKGFAPVREETPARW